MESKVGSLFDFLNKHRRRRKYYLHHRLKLIFKINSRSKTIVVTEHSVESASDFERACLYELRDEYDYNIQFSIPQ